MTCKNCGATLQPNDTLCSECGTVAEITAVKCRECGKFYDKDLGLCPFCSAVFSETPEPDVKSEEQTDGTLEKKDIEITPEIALFMALGKIPPQKQEEDDSICPDCGEQLDMEYGLCYSCGYSVKKSKAKEIDEAAKDINDDIEEKPTANVIQTSGVRDTLLEYLKNIPFFNGLLGFSVICAVLYPIHLLLSLLDMSNAIFDFTYSIHELLIAAYYVGIVLCFAKKQNMALLAAFCIMLVYHCASLVLSVPYVSFNDLTVTSFYAVLCIWSFRQYYNDNINTPHQEKEVYTYSKSDSSIGKKIAIIAVIVIVLIIIIAISSLERCSQCGEIVTEGYRVAGEPWCSDCFYDY